MKTIRYIIYIFVYILLIGISGLLNIVLFKELDWSTLQSVEFWLEIAIDYTLYFAIFITTALMVYEVFSDKDVEFIKIETDIFAMKNELVTQAFRNNVYNHNFEKKLDTWKEIVLTAIGNHERKKKDKMILASHPDLFEKMFKGTRWYWKIRTRRWNSKNKKLHSFMQEKWVNRNLMFRKRFRFGIIPFVYFRKIKYPEITPNEVIYGVQSLPTKSSVLARKPLGKRLALKAVTILPSIIFKIIYELFKIDRFVSTAELLKALAFTIIMMLIHALFGIYTARRAHMDRKSNATIRYGFAYDYVVNGYRYPQAPKIELEKEITIEEEII